MKVLHLISSGGMYGAEAVILNLCSALNRAGDHSSALAVFANTTQPNFQLRDAALPAGIETHTIECRGQFDSSVPARLQQLVRDTQADVIHTHGYKADIYAWWGLRRAGLPLVSTCHNWIDNDIALRIYGWLDRMVLRRFTRVVAVSDAVRSRLLSAGLSNGQVTVIRNGILLAPFQAAASQRSSAERLRTVGFVGRLSPEKGPDIFVRTAALVLEDFPTTRFILAGEGPERVPLEALIEELGIQEHVTLLGRQDDMPSLYGSMSIMVLSSRTEGLPMALLEAMASGLPVVATRVGEVPNVVQDRDTGLLVEPNDAAGLASGIMELLRNPVRRLAMGSNATARVAIGFSAENMTQEYLAVYRDALLQATDPAEASAAGSR